MRDIEERRAIEAIRGFFDMAASGRRVVTSEWLAGRLGLPLVICETALDRLVDARFIRRIPRQRMAPVYARRTKRRRTFGAHLVVALLVLTAVTGAFFVALNSRYVFIAGEALAVGLIIAFAWLDAELRDSTSREPPKR